MLMDKALIKYLEDRKIKYIVHKHPAVFTVEESLKIDKQMPDVFHTKNLFLKDNAKKFYLVCMHAHDRVDLKTLKDTIGATKKLTFTSSEELKEHLNLSPGSVSLFGMIYATDVTLILDKKIWDAKKVGFHPNVNTATLELTQKDLETFYNSLQCEKHVMEIPVK